MDEKDLSIALRVSQLEALLSLLIKKGIITTDEFSNELNEYINSINNKQLKKELTEYINSFNLES